MLAMRVRRGDSPTINDNLTLISEYMVDASFNTRAGEVGGEINDLFKTILEGKII